MEVLFENSTVRTKEACKELFGMFYFKRPLYIIVDVTLLICAAFSVYMHVITGEGNYAVYFLTIFMFFLQLISYSSSVRTQLKRDEEMFGDKPALIEYSVTGDKIIYRCKNSETELNFSQIKKVYRTRNLITLHSKANLAYVMAKDGFSIGTADGFVSFLREKGVKVK